MNNIIIDNKTNYQLDENHILKITREVLRILEVKGSILEIIFVEKDEIRELNITHRKINNPTDVLSFPQPEIPTAKARLLGSIVISPEVVEEKDESIDDVIKHGLLHLLGFDHEKEVNSWEESAIKIKCEL